MILSVVICTHNPRRDYLARVLDSLKVQTLPIKQWELVLIDNASKETLANFWDLSWHPHARHLHEKELGRTQVRLRGIAETKGEILIFVDDDNIFASDFLEQTARISIEWPFLGAWSGQLKPEFEIEPEAWMREFLPMLDLREFDRILWSNTSPRNGALPYGAGLCVRRKVADCYAGMARGDYRRIGLGRIGQQLSSAGDIDMALTSCDLGLGTGLFPELILTHLIPRERLTEDYLVNLCKGDKRSKMILGALRGETPLTPSRSQRLMNHLEGLFLPRRKRRFFYAQREGEDEAINALASRERAQG